SYARCLLSSSAGPLEMAWSTTKQSNRRTLFLQARKDQIQRQANAINSGMKVTNHFDKGLIPIGLYMLTVVAFTISLADASQDDVYVKGGEFGDVKVASFIMDKHHVTVGEFHEFVETTGYVTEAEKFGSAGVFDFEEQRFVGVEGAYYLFPFGKSAPKAATNHPVTQVSWNDAVAYGKWKGKRLPTRLEWEYAASSGTRTDATYSWGEGFT